MNTLAERIAAAECGRTHLFALGQAGFVIKSASGQLLAIDLYLTDCVERLEGHMGFKRMLPRLLMPDELAFNAVIATHPHWDHYDVDAMPAIMRTSKTKLYASTGCRGLVQGGGIDENRVVYVTPGVLCKAGDFELHFIHCDHGEGAPDAVGVLICVDGKLILEAGDTCLRLDREAEYLHGGTPDILIAPINGKFGNMTEDDCARLAHALQPRLTIPCHYGMCASHGGDPGKFYNIMTTQYSSLPFCVMGMGEQLTLA